MEITLPRSIPKTPGIITSGRSGSGSISNARAAAFALSIVHITFSPLLKIHFFSFGTQDIVHCEIHQKKIKKWLTRHNPPSIIRIIKNLTHKPMIENSKFGAGTSQRAADGVIAAGTAGLNGLMRAGRKALQRFQSAASLSNA